jgi:ABC-2 type transport system permease protein
MLQHLSNVFRLGIKELFSLRHDAMMVFLIVYSFTYGVYTPAKNASFGMVNASVGIVDEDRSQLSLRIRDALRPPFFLEPGALALQDVDRAMDTSRFTFVVDIPANFEADIKRGRQPELQIIADATAMTQAGTGVGYLQSIISREVAATAGASQGADQSPVNLVTRAKFNPNLESSSFMAVMQIINNITMLAMFLTGAAIIREREHGTIEHLLVMPLTPTEVMLAKVWANGLVIVVAATLSLRLIVQWILELPIAGSIPLFVSGVVIYLFSITALGIFLGTLGRSMPQFALLAFTVNIVMNLLSGGNTPLDSMPAAMQAVMQFSPATHFVSFSQAILYRGAGLDVVWTDFAAAAALGALFFGGALARFRQTMAD